MNKVSGCLDGVQWYRTSKQAARNAYNAGEEVLICAVNLNPFSGWCPGVVINETWEQSFQGIVDNYCWHNANSDETGKYAAFYLKEKGKG